MIQGLVFFYCMHTLLEFVSSYKIFINSASLFLHPKHNPRDFDN